MTNHRVKIWNNIEAIIQQNYIVLFAIKATLQPNKEHHNKSKSLDCTHVDWVRVPNACIPLDEICPSVGRLCLYEAGLSCVLGVVVVVVNQFLAL